MNSKGAQYTVLAAITLAVASRGVKGVLWAVPLTVLATVIQETLYDS